MVSFLIRELIDTGRTIAWLNAANDQARSVYARLGFRSIGRLLNYEEGHASEVQPHATKCSFSLPASKARGLR